MKTLYVIGNGFDLHHNLPTQYSNFSKYLEKTNIELFSALEICCNFDYKWKDFEDKLSTFNISSLTFDNKDLIDDGQNCLIGILEQAKEKIKYLKNDLNNWILETIKYPDLEDVNEPVEFQENALFLSFNYTRTLEEVYGIKNVWHIHNIPKRIIKNRYDSFPDDKVISELVVGYDKNKKISKTNFEYENMICGYNFEEILLLLQKPTSSIISSHKKKFNNYSNFDKVVILGHSLGECDIPYFQEIEQKISSKAFFEISYYDRSEKLELERQSNKFVKNHRVSFKEFRSFCRDAQIM